MSEWMNTGIFVIFYLALGMVCAVVREVRLGAIGRDADVEGFFALIVLWPFMVPYYLLAALCKWLWNVGFNRNLPPLNQHPTAKPYKKYEK